MEKEVVFLIEKDITMQKKVVLKGIKKDINFMYLQPWSIKDNKSDQQVGLLGYNLCLNVYYISKIKYRHIFTQFSLHRLYKKG